MKAVFDETRSFTRQVLAQMFDDDYRLLQAYLMENPTAGKVIPGGGGLRKIRWKGKGKGKRGGVRIIYYWAAELAIMLMLYMYPKSAQKDLSAGQVKVLSELVKKEYP